MHPTKIKAPIASACFSRFRITMPTPYPLTTTIVPSPSLSTFARLQDLAAMLNSSFTHAHLYGAGYQTLPASTGRLKKPEQLAGELGPDGFCLVAFSSDPTDQKGQTPGGRIVATASAKPYHPDKSTEGAGSEVNLMFKRPAPNGNSKTEARQLGKKSLEESDADLPAWEILAMAVEPELQGKGVSNQILELTLDEIKRVVQDTEKENKGIRILISAMKEITGEYYAKKGWKMTEERRMPSGTAGSTTGFTIVDMVRIV